MKKNSRSCSSKRIKRRHGRKSTSKLVSRKSKKLGFQGYDLMIAREHRNQLSSLSEIIRYQFRSCKIKFSFFPFLLPIWNLNAYVIVKIIK